VNGDFQFVEDVAAVVDLVVCRQQLVAMEVAVDVVFDDDDAVVVDLSSVQVLVLELIELEFLALILSHLFVMVECGKAMDYRLHFSLQ
jgi:hypothetical protein